jgi:twitching motility protein PilT
MSAPQQAAVPTIPDLLRQARTFGASDLHIRVGLPPMCRIHGEIAELPNRPILGPKMVSEMLAPLMGGSDSPYRRYMLEEKSVDFSFPVEGVGRFRVNIFMQQRNLGAVMRHIPDQVPSLDQINVPKAILKFIDLQRGLVLITGPTGSGKSTTLAAIIDAINTKKACHILTIEHPIEFVHQSKRSIVNQREVDVDTPDFPRALRDALRQDPDVILIGEMRDLETTRTALAAAETGHLVFGTLHTKSADSTIERIIDQFPGNERSFIRIQLAAVLEGVVTQTLLPTADGEGRVPAHEVLIVDDPTRASIRSGKSSTEIRNVLQTRASIGCQTLDKALVHWVRQKKVDLNVARERAQDVKEFDRLIQSAGQGAQIQEIEFIGPEDVPRPMSRDMGRTAQVQKPTPGAGGTSTGSTPPPAKPNEGGGISFDDLPDAFTEDD